MELFDLSVPIRAGMIVYEGDPDVRLERTASRAEGANCNVSRMDMSVHTGTHIDAPVHFIDRAAGVESIPLGQLVGPAYVVDATAIREDIDAAVLATLDIPPEATRVLFKTPNSELWARDAFAPDFFGLMADAARDRAARSRCGDPRGAGPSGHRARPVHAAVPSASHRRERRRPGTRGVDAGIADRAPFAAQSTRPKRFASPSGVASPERA